MSSSPEAPAADSLEWKPLLFVRYREGKKVRTADLRGSEWSSSLASILDAVTTVEKRLWKDQRIDVGVRDGSPAWVRIVREYDGRTGTSFISWGDVLAVEYEGETVSLGEAFFPSPQAAT
ncbi:MAG: hypothetical protein F4Z77_03935 [Dehalococcoidia bacterium]|nr:hypothetical protein [Chloroflexota bacterium]MXW25438.1 hypothetical protein [Dehalococcoidia bacterium]MXY87784.1 hypothetical protein [Dehalococcoidia bacterium]MXZ88757.1 hypothetical protein [Dehalococcoidia bacterium]MYA54459.1 hypothetical protein [Dehalococcoidia bacterium]